MEFYAGIGARITPVFVQEVMTNLARLLMQSNYHLRSGGARGADWAFERGVRRQAHILGLSPYPMTIYHPWPNPPYDYVHIPIDPTKPEKYPAVQLAAQHHAAWDKLTSNQKALHTRNAFIILGKELDQPANFVICWTENGKAKGGTGQALAIANTFQVPIYNLRNPFTFSAVKEIVAQNEPIDFLSEMTKKGIEKSNF